MTLFLSQWCEQWLKSLDLHWDDACCKWDEPSAELSSCCKEANSSKMSCFTISIKAITVKVAWSSLLLLQSQRGHLSTVQLSLLHPLQFPLQMCSKEDSCLQKTNIISSFARKGPFAWIWNVTHSSKKHCVAGMNPQYSSVLLLFAINHFTPARSAALIRQVKNANEEVSWEVSCCYKPNTC